MQKRILIIGSVHLDIVASYEKSIESNVDKEGDLKFSVGGAAYNIAANLAYKDHRVSLFTFVKDNSVSGDVIKSAISAANIETHFVQHDSDLSESGYVSHQSEGDLISAVSCMSIQEKAFDKNVRKDLAKAISSHSFVVVDTNLSTNQLETVVEICREKNTSIFACNVSDSKCHRLVDFFPEDKSEIFRFVSLNEKELKQIVENDFIEDSKHICRKLRSKTVVVTHGRNGFTVYSQNSDENYKSIPYNAAGIKSELGAGDALFSAVCAHYSIKNEFQWRDCDQLVNEYVARVLKSEGATPEGLQFKVEKNKQNISSQSKLSLIPFALSAAFTVLAFFIVDSASTYALCFFFVPFLAGISGAFTRHLLGRVRKLTSDIMPNIALGGVAGLAMGITFFLSHWVTLSESMKVILEGNGVPDNMRPIIGFLLVAGLLAGLAVEVAFDQIKNSKIKYTHEESQA